MKLDSQFPAPHVIPQLKILLFENTGILSYDP